MMNIVPQFTKFLKLHTDDMNQIFKRLQYGLKDTKEALFGKMEQRRKNHRHANAALDKEFLASYFIATKLGYEPTVKQQDRFNQLIDKHIDARNWEVIERLLLNGYDYNPKQFNKIFLNYMQEQSSQLSTMSWSTEFLKNMTAVHQSSVANEEKPIKIEDYIKVKIYDNECQKELCQNFIQEFLKPNSQNNSTVKIYTQHIMHHDYLFNLIAQHMDGQAQQDIIFAVANHQMKKDLDLLDSLNALQEEVKPSRLQRWLLGDWTTLPPTDSTHGRSLDNFMMTSGLPMTCTHHFKHVVQTLDMLLGNKAQLHAEDLFKICFIRDKEIPQALTKYFVWSKSLVTEGAGIELERKDKSVSAEEWLKEKLEKIQLDIYPIAQRLLQERENQENNRQEFMRKYPRI